MVQDLLIFFLRNRSRDGLELVIRTRVEATAQTHEPLIAAHLWARPGRIRRRGGCSHRRLTFFEVGLPRRFHCSRVCV